jgi:hypothetical protein
MCAGTEYTPGVGFPFSTTNTASIAGDHSPPYGISSLKSIMEPLKVVVPVIRDHRSLSSTPDSDDPRTRLASIRQKRRMRSWVTELFGRPARVRHNNNRAASWRTATWLNKQRRAEVRDILIEHSVLETFLGRRYVLDLVHVRIRQFQPTRCTLESGHIVDEV